MSKVARKWIEDDAINADKLDDSDSFTIAGLTVNGDSSATGDVYVGGQLGIGATNPGGAVEIYDSTNALLVFNIQDSTVGNRVGEISMNGLDQSSNATEFSEITTVIVDNTEGSEDGRIDFNVMSAGTVTNKMTVAPTSVGIGTTNPNELVGLYIAPGGGDCALSFNHGDIGGGTAGQGEITMFNSGHFKMINRYSSGNAEVVSGSSGEVLLSAGGANRLVINSSGDVGIGTTDPQRKVHIWQTSGDLVINSSSDVGIGTTDPQREVHIWQTSGDASIGVQQSAANNMSEFAQQNDGSLLIANRDTSAVIKFAAGGAERMRITSSGNVGIGTTNPLQALDIEAGDINLDAGQALRWNNSGNGISMAIGAGPTDRYISMLVNGSEKARINGSGDVGIGTSTPTDGNRLAVQETGDSARISMQRSDLTGSGQVGALRWYSAHGAQYRAQLAVEQPDGNSSSMIFYTRDSSSTDERMRIHTNGKVGIGTTDPQQNLHVQGNIYATGAIFAEGEYGIDAITEGSPSNGVGYTYNFDSGAYLVTAHATGGGNTKCTTEVHLVSCHYQFISSTSLMDVSPGGTDYITSVAFSNVSDQVFRVTVTCQNSAGSLRVRIQKLSRP